MPTTHDILPGSPYPLGATLQNGGVNFSLFSAHATAVELLLFDYEDQPSPSRVIALDPEINRTYYYWHVFVPGIGDGQIYGYRVYGPYAPERG
ncbi:MAG: glycogen debranching enzyme, partial [Chloroflexi bacterium]|nr:glycogen debranching enzyme [Chloroflexota bacterium]